MTISKDLLLAILSMDAYNRGYGAGIDSLSQDKGTQIGTAAISENAEDILAEGSAVAAGFYAISYDTTFGKVVSYRGTNEDGTSSENFFINAIKDIWNGWTIGAGVTDGIWGAGSQAQLAIDFYEGVADNSIYDSTQDPITLTGHSLGGDMPPAKEFWGVAA